ncbi:MAG: lysophospholipid acyltransferase family protein [Eubacteriales bacterium]|nr:lysophospholipid acyltransferase family protein [Eubacteriales bacterium]
MIRGLFILLEILLLIIVSILFIPIMWVIRFFAPEFVQSFSQGLTRFFAKLAIFICGTEIEVIGKENLPDEPCLYVANHRSYFDIIMTMTLIRKKSFYIAKQSIGKIPFLHFWMISFRCLLIDRDDIKQSLKVILQAIDQIKAGYSCFIFPEGHRTSGPEHEMQPFKEGSFKPAQKAKVPVCPITIINARSVFEAQQPRFKKAKCTIIIDKPFRIDELDAADAKHPGAYSRNIILQNLVRHQTENAE